MARRGINIETHFGVLMQVRYGQAEPRTSLGPFNASIDPDRKTDGYYRSYPAHFLSQQLLGAIRWDRAVANSRKRRGATP